MLMSAQPNPYSVALKKAENELAKCNSAMSVLELKRTKLRQTIAGLQAQLGIPVQREVTLTEAILLVVKMSDGHVRASEVTRWLTDVGYEAQYPSVATILNRLSKPMQRQIDCFVDRESGVNGYIWRAELTKAERLEAHRELASKAPKKK